ncbi:ATP-binding protein [Streptomyces albus]|uniref:ATP-binding protein n=1 Tax=Streptomyces albus TaxID=1888 RepID=UPI0036FF3CB9
MRTTTGVLPGQTARTFDREASSVPKARHWVNDIYTDLGAPDAVLETCALLVSEVVTNAVLYGAGPEFSVVVDSDFYIEVWDGADKLPRRRTHAVDSTSGRGLELLELLAPGYRVIRDPDRTGKGIRFLPRGWT